MELLWALTNAVRRLVLKLSSAFDVHESAKVLDRRFVMRAFGPRKAEHQVPRQLLKLTAGGFLEGPCSMQRVPCLPLIELRMARGASVHRSQPPPELLVVQP